MDIKKAFRDFWYGKPHGERRLGDNYLPKSGLYKHREWRGLGRKLWQVKARKPIK